MDYRDDFGIVGVFVLVMVAAGSAMSPIVGFKDCDDFATFHFSLLSMLLLYTLS